MKNIKAKIIKSKKNTISEAFIIDKIVPPRFSKFAF